MWDMADIAIGLAMDELVQESHQKYLDDNWLHEDMNGNQYKLSEMSVSHLKSCIKFFRLYWRDSKYHKELHRRNIFYRIIK